MKKELLLGIDLGTTKVAVVVADHSKKLYSVSSEPHRSDTDAGPGRSEQDPARIMDVCMNQIRSIPGELRKYISAIGVTGQMHGIMLMDRNLDPLSDVITWQDQRCNETAGLLDEVYQQTGYRLHNGFGFASLIWMMKKDHLPGSAKWCCQVTDHLVAKMTGLERPVIDHAGAASWGFYDIMTNTWDEGAIKKCNIPHELLPAVVTCGSRAGKLSDLAASEYGLNPGIPVAAATGDNQASLFATIDDPGKQIALTLGTGGQISVILDRPQRIEGPSRFEYRPYVDCKAALVAASLCGGSAWDWLARSLISFLKDMDIQPPSKEKVFEIMNEAGLHAGDEIRVFPHFLGERYDPSLRGSIHNIDPSNFALGSLARAVAYGTVRTLKEMIPEEVLHDRSEIIGTGNAVRRVPLIREAIQETFRMPLAIPDFMEEAGVGAALLAGRLI